VAAALRRAFPSARIDWLVGEKHRDLLDLVPVIDRRLVMRDASWWPRVIADLRRERYDAAIDAQGLIKSALLAWGSGAKQVVGFAAPYLRERPARVFYTDTYDAGGSGLFAADNPFHQVRLNLGLLEPLGLTVTTPEFPIETAASPAVAEVRAQIGGPYAVLNPGAAWPNKRWPTDRFGALAQALRSRNGLLSIVSWGPGEEALASEVVAASAGAARLAPPTTISDLVALVRGARLVVSGDTGPLHVATAVGTPVVAIHGPTRPTRTGPWAAADIAVSRDTICRCVHQRRCHMPVMCLMDIGVDEVAGAAGRRLALEPTRA
jgi:heptosyltransferase-1